MTILVTGGAGFIGSHLVQKLLVHSSARVVILDNFNDYYDPQLKRAAIAGFKSTSRVAVVEGDFCDQALDSQILMDQEVRAVIHLGASPGVPASLTHPRQYLENNVLGTLALLEAVRRHPVDRFLFASSSTVYGRGAAAPFVEDGTLGTPASPYGASKRSAELLGLTYHELFGIPFTSLRLFNVYGPRLRPELALAVFTRAILEERPLPLYGDGSVLRDFTHVSDICAGFLAAMQAPNIAGECINLGHDRPIAIGRLIELVERAAGKKAMIDRKPQRGEDMPFTHADLAKARRLLAYDPQMGIEQGVQEYVDWFRANYAI